MDPLKPDATPEEITAWVDDAIAKFTAMQTDLAAVTAERDEAAGKLAEIENAKSMAEIDALLADYELPDDTRAAMVDLAKSNRPQASALLTAMPKKKAPEAAPVDPAKPEVKKEAPAPLHNPGNPAAPLTPEAKAAAAEKLIAEIRKAGRFPAYEAARAEARRQKPELFS